MITAQEFSAACKAVGLDEELFWKRFYEAGSYESVDDLLSIKDKPEEVIIAAFQWPKTEEGREYWEDLYNRLAKYTKPNTPQHYQSTIEPIDAIEAWGLGFALGNVIKYVARAGKKTADPMEDLVKAKWYIEREIERLALRGVDHEVT